ncbi:Crp/Fnr family transcriptional regulator [Sphingomonas bacterium]|uniref:Crp/Fnr family transcriptional regulator n=1 Tax=Sphingomonas bacterium TaxID=1895847 RepID=UPI0020C68825|nr:Crp/Fnr family transcriptional regulator [Sphingomonas bacterium]
MVTPANAFVRKIKAYGLLADGDVRRLVEASDPPRKIAAHRDLIREGDKPSVLFVILEGWACRYKVLPDGNRQIMAFLMPGDFCDVHAGELEEMDHSIGTLTPCLIVTVPRRDVEALVISTPALTRAFWRAQLIDEGVLRAWIVSMGRRNALERVAHLMLELYARMRNVGLTTDHSCELPLTQVVLGDALGLTSVHVNRVLRELRQQGIMELGARTLRILDIIALGKIAGFDDNYLHRKIGKVA